MIQELVELGSRIDDGTSRALRKEKVDVDIVINSNGEIDDFYPTNGFQILAEYIIAKKGKARLLLDKADEVLGVGDHKKHQLFLDKLEQYKDVSILKPVFLFYDSKNEKGLKLAQQKFEALGKKDKSWNYTFRIGTTRLLKEKEVQNAIIKRFDENELKIRNGRTCSICGRNEIPVIDEPHGNIKFYRRFFNKEGELKQPMMGQKAGNCLVSYNENAFLSYGLKGNENSSICRECAYYYTNALQHLESDWIPKNRKDNDKGKEKKVVHYNHRFDLSDSTIALFWTKEDTEGFDHFECYDAPNADFVSSLFESLWKGDQKVGAVVDTNMFYCCTITPEARIIVRDWTAISLDSYKRHLAEWFKDIEIEDYDGSMTYSPLKSLINATQKENKGGKALGDLDAKSRIGPILWKNAIQGSTHKVPIEILHHVLNRIFLKDSFTVTHAALIKLIINRNTKQQMKSTLDPANRSVAYLCGRLFAVIEVMQQRAIGKVNSNIKNRYFAAAAAQPAYIIGNLLTKNVPIYQHKIGGYLAKDLEDIAGTLSEINSIPNRFTPIEQGEFALGYYFQKTHKSEHKEETTTN